MGWSERPAPVAPARMTPFSVHVGTLIDALRMPVVRSSFRLGNELRTSGGKGVRSRIVDMMVKGSRREIRAFVLVGSVGRMVSLKTVMSTREDWSKFEKWWT